MEQLITQDGVENYHTEALVSPKSINISTGKDSALWRTPGGVSGEIYTDHCIKKDGGSPK